MSVNETVAYPQVRVRVRRSVYEALRDRAEREDRSIASYAGQLIAREIERLQAIQKRRSA